MILPRIPFALSACAVALLASAALPLPARAAEAPEAAADPGTLVTTPEARYHILLGELAANRQDAGIAAAEFLAALETVNDPALAERATSLAFSAGSAELVERGARRWLELAPNEMEPREALLALYVQRGDLDAAQEQAQAIIDGHAGGPDDGFRAVGSLLAQQPGPAAIAAPLLERLSARQPKVAGGHYARALLALRQGDLATADREARTALELEPAARENALLLVGVLVRAGKLDEADQRMDTLARQRSREAADLRMAYIKLLVEARQNDRARAQIERTLKDSPKNEDARYALAIFELNDGHLDRARALFEGLAASHDRGADARYQLGRIAEQQKRYEDALALYSSVISGNSALEAAIRRSTVLARLGRIGEARDSLHRVGDQFPPLRERMLLAEGELLMLVGRREDALTAYTSALTQLPDSDDLLYGRSLVYDQLGRSAEAEADLRAILKLKPDDARALNALGYLLSNAGGTRLGEARQLIEKAFAIEPDDPAIMDSLGWVNFKLGKPEQARDLLVKAHGLAADPEIAAHLGEVLWTLGQRDQARAVWEDALKDSPDHAVLKETIQRLSP